MKMSSEKHEIQDICRHLYYGWPYSVTISRKLCANISITHNDSNGFLMYHLKSNTHRFHMAKGLMETSGCCSFSKYAARTFLVYDFERILCNYQKDSEWLQRIPFISIIFRFHSRWIPKGHLKS